MKIQKLIIEGMHNVRKRVYVFDDKTYLMGPNGSGKSTVLEAIQLALLGYIPATGKTKGSVCAHSPASNLKVTLYLENGASTIKVVRTFMTVRGSATSETTIEPPEVKLDEIMKDIELPIFNFDEFLGMTANAQKDWFLKFLAPKSTDVDILGLLMNKILDMDVSVEAKEYVIPLLSSKWAEIQDLSAIQALSELCTYLKSIQTAKKADSARLGGTVNSLVRYDDEDGVPEDISELNAETARLSAIRDQIQNYMTLKSQQDRVDALLHNIGFIHPDGCEQDPEVVECRKTLNALIEEIHLVEEAIQECSTDIDKLNQDRASVYALVAKGDGQCPYTGKVCETVKAQVDKYKEKLASIDAAIADKQRVYSDLKMKRESGALHKNLTSTQLDAVLSRYDRYYELSKASVSVPAKPDMTFTEVDTEMSAIRDRIMKIGANAAYDKLKDAAVRDKFICDSVLSILKMLITETGPNGMQTTFAEKPFTDMEAALSEYIHLFFGLEVSAKFILSSKSGSFSFGTYDNDTETYVPFAMLSSGEKCMFALALLSCIVNNSASPLKLILIDDLFDHLDSGNCKQVFEKIVSVPDIQYIIAGVVPCECEGIAKLNI